MYGVQKRDGCTLNVACFALPHVSFFCRIQIPETFSRGKATSLMALLANKQKFATFMKNRRAKFGPKELDEETFETMLHNLECLGDVGALEKFYSSTSNNVSTPPTSSNERPIVHEFALGSPSASFAFSSAFAPSSFELSRSYDPSDPWDSLTHQNLTSGVPDHSVSEMGAPLLVCLFVCGCMCVVFGT
jgi:hypothetical protein